MIETFTILLSKASFICQQADDGSPVVRKRMLKIRIELKEENSAQGCIFPMGEQK